MRGPRKRSSLRGRAQVIPSDLSTAVQLIYLFISHLSKAAAAIDTMKGDPTFVSVSEQHRGNTIDHDAEKELNEPGISAAIPEKYRGTQHDKREMSMLGKKQVLRRNFKFVTMLGFAST